MKNNQRLVYSFIAISTALTARLLTVHAAPPNPEPILPSTDKAEITLTYNSLKQLLHEFQSTEPPQQPKPPIKATIRSASYRVELITKKSATVTATFSITTFDEGWITQPLISSKYALQSVTPPSTVLTPVDEHLALVTRGASEQQISLTFIVPVHSDASFSLDLIAASSSHLDLSNHDKFSVQGAVISSEGIHILPATGARVKIIPNREAEVSKDSSWTADSRVLYTAIDNELKSEAHLQLIAKDGDSGTSANIIMPKDSRILTITGPDLLDWKSSQQDTQHAIRLTWKSPGISRRRIIILYALPLPDVDELWTLNIPCLKKPAKTTGLLALVTPAEFQLTPVETLSHLEPSLAPDWMKSHGLPVILKLPQARDIQLKGKRLAQIQTATATIQQAQFKTQIVNDGSTLTEGVITLSHSEPKLWTFTLPKDSNILRCSIDGLSANPIILNDGTLQLTLKAKHSGKKPVSQVQLSFTSKLEKIQPLTGKLSLALPSTPLFIHELHWQITLPDPYEASALDGNLTLDLSKKTGRAISLVKRLSRNQAANVDIFYRKKAH